MVQKSIVALRERLIKQILYYNQRIFTISITYKSKTDTISVFVVQIMGDMRVYSKDYLILFYQ